MKIGIVGGGIAGLTAAFRLSQKGTDCVLFEKQSFTGGRIDYCVCITTPDFQPRLYALGRELSLEEAEVPFLPNSIAMLAGKDFLGFENFPKMVESLPSEEKNYYQKIMQDAMMSSFDIEQPSERLKELRQISFAEYLKDCPPKLMGMVIEPMMGFTFMWPLDLSRFSADYGLFQIRFGAEMGGGRANTFEENVKMLTNVLERKILDFGSRVCLSAEVKKVQKQGNGFEVYFEEESQEKTERVDKVIFATPLPITQEIMPELSLEKGIFYEKSKCIFVQGKLKTDRTVILGVPFQNVANLRCLFVAYPNEHQIYPMDIAKPVDFSVLYDDYKVLSEKEVEMPFPILAPGGKAPEVQTRIDGAFVCGDFYYYPTIDTSIRTAEKVAEMIIKGK